jgi:monoamine oxidase
MKTLAKVFCLMSIFLSTASSFAEQRSPTVIVVGAGLAGLTTAYRLQQKGINVHVYEARGRVGGRVFTAVVGGGVAELGGQNITDGGKADNMRRLIGEFDLELAEIRFNLSHSFFDGKIFIPGHLLYNRGFNPEELQLKLADLAQKSQNMKEVLDALFEEEDPLHKILSMRLAAYEGASVEKLSPVYVETLYHMLLGGVCSVHENNCIDLVSIKGGTTLLPERLAGSLGVRVHLKMPLTAISKALDGSYDLTFQNGQKVQADILVLAIPCSVYSTIAFGKNLIPEDRLAAIKNVQYGTNAKILIPFAQEPPEKVASRFASHRSFVSFFGPNCHVLILYYTGEAGRFSAETLLETYQQDRPMIEMGFGDLCPPFEAPIYARDESFASYEGPVGYSWPNDPYAKGSYSYIAPGQEKLLTATHNDNGEVVKTLFAPIDHTLYFAGEHAAILMDVPGTMEAACESGERAARMISRTLKLPH